MSYAITFGTGPDYSPMPDPGGRGIYYVNGKSSGFLTAYHVHSKESVESRREVTIYRQLWSDGKIIGKPQVALKVPFAFPIFYFNGNGYDFSRDLSTIVYARPSGHADLYLLSQK